MDFMIDVSNRVLSMVQLRVVYLFVLLIGVDFIEALEPVETKPEKNEDFDFSVSKKDNKERSTSSSSGEKKKEIDKDDEDSGVDKDSLDMTDFSGSKSASAKHKDTTKVITKGTDHGWRVWHRQCVPCISDMKKKWRDPSIGWICGGYQRARRTFKSSCMMRFRNCQDGTMFVKIHSGMCKNDTSSDPQPHGDHFFYDYKVRLSEDSSDSRSTSDSVSSSESSSLTLSSSD